MARPLRIQFSGALYHVMARGNARQPIFGDDQDRRKFLMTLWQVCERVDWQVWAYCLMENHYHLLLETARPTLAQGMRDLNSAYSQAFNRRSGRVGHLFQGRYKTVLVEKESYLLELSRYIVLNPVKSGGCTSPERWLWSSYRATLGLARAPRRLAVSKLLAQFPASGTPKTVAFVAFVQAGLTLPDPAAERRVPTFAASDEYIATLGARVACGLEEVPKVERAWKSLNQYEYENPVRNAAIRAAYESGSYTLKAIGDHFGLHYATVSRIARANRATDVAIQDLTP